MSIKNIRKRSVVSVLMIVAMILSAGAFASCINEPEIAKYNIKITSYDGSVETSFDGVTTAELGTEPTVLDCTRFFCKDVMGWDFEYDATLAGGTVKKISSHISELFVSEFIEECEACAELEDGESCDECLEEDDDDVIKDYYYDWVFTLNGEEAKLSDLIKDGDTIVWEWKQVQKEHEDKWETGNR